MPNNDIPSLQYRFSGYNLPTVTLDDGFEYVKLDVHPYYLNQPEFWGTKGTFTIPCTSAALEPSPSIPSGGYSPEPSSVWQSSLRSPLPKIPAIQPQGNNKNKLYGMQKF